MNKYTLLFILLIIFGAFLLFTLSAKSPSTQLFDFASPSTQERTDGRLEGTFEATTPCNRTISPFTSIPFETDCEMAIWNVVFNADKTYTLSVRYGMSQPNATEIKNGGTNISIGGSWTHDPVTGTITLTDPTASPTISFIQITDDVIHILDTQQNMMVGHGGWSYTLNKINSTTSAEANYVYKNSGELISGVFEGRTPCQDFLLTFSQSSVNSPTGCQRIKWLITFYPAEATGKPSTYVFGIQDRKESHRGTVNIFYGTSIHPDSIVYQLVPDDNRQGISLLQVGNNHLFFLDKNMHFLVGNKSLSYTLSKTAESYEMRKSPLELE